MLATKAFYLGPLETFYIGPSETFYLSH